MSQLDIPDELFCPGCGYSLHGIESSRCPECGLVIDHELIKRSVIPWTHRKQLGRWIAFRKTIWFILRNPRGLKNEASRRVDYSDAQKFRWLVVLSAWAPLAIVALVLRFLEIDLRWGDLNTRLWSARPISPLMDIQICMWVGYRMWVVPGIALFLFVAGISGVPSYFFAPKSIDVVRQNRAVALSSYLCASLALLIFPCLALGYAGLMYYFDPEVRGESQFRIFVTLQIVGYALLAGILGSFWVRTLHLQRASLQAGPTRLVAVAILLPVLWIVIAVLTLVAFPSLWGLIKLMAVSSTP